MSLTIASTLPLASRGATDNASEMTFFSRHGALAVTAVSLLACGARTGLLVPDVSEPSDAVADVPVIVDVAPRVCTPGSFVLEPRAAEVLLVIDRSSSMGQSLTGRGGGTSKWELLRSALATTLPTFQDRINVGALFYPESGAATRTAACALSNIPSVDVDPSVNTAARLLAVFDASDPGGSTPTAAALLRAYTYFVRHPSRARARYLVLATDGGPNCNAALDPAVCECIGGGGGCRGGGGLGGLTGGNMCLDRVRTRDEIRDIATNPVTAIPTYVIGMADSTERSAALETTLTEMAIAGGRPNHTATGAETYYDVRRDEDLATAFTAVQNAIARCTFVTPSTPTSTNGLSLAVNGVAVPYDPTHANGWDWTDRAYGELALFGPACPSNAASAPTATAIVECHADGG